MRVTSRASRPQKPDTDADFAEYLAARQPRLMRTAYLISGDADLAEDLVQTALAKLYLAWDRVGVLEHRDAYVRRMIINEHASWWRRRKRRPETATDSLPERPREDSYDDGTRAEIWAFVQTLPARQRAVVVLRYYEQLTEAEIADVLGISPGTVKSQCSRALAALRKRAPHHLDPTYQQKEEGR
jgi:RNA polymerase sigma-70 factor (sigma-E family)